MGDEGENIGLATRAQTRTARHQREAAAVEARRVERRRRAVLLVIWAAVSTVGVIVTALLRGLFDPLELVFFTSVVATIAFASFSGVFARPTWLMERQIAAGADPALAVGHLPGRLADLARETRALRLAVEAADPGDAAIDAWVWAWISSVRELGPLEREVLARLELSTTDVEAVLLGEALAPDPEGGPAPGEPRAIRSASTREAQVRRVELLAEHFEAFEVALLRYRPDPYRGR